VCFIYSLVSIAVSTQSLFRLTASLSPAVATTRPSKSGTFPLAIATRRWPGTQSGKFFFFQIIFPKIDRPLVHVRFFNVHDRKITKKHFFFVDLNTCEYNYSKKTFCSWKYARKWYKCQRYQNVRLRVPSDRALEIVRISKFSSLVLLIHVMTSRNFRVRSVARALMESKLPAVAGTTSSRFGTRNLGIASWRSVDWQSPDCESQILMVSSTLPLAIFFPSGLHATERTLKL